jgi:hypothetical protein
MARPVDSGVSMRTVPLQVFFDFAIPHQARAGTPAGQFGTLSEFVVEMLRRVSLLPIFRASSPRFIPAN